MFQCPLCFENHSSAESFCQGAKHEPLCSGCLRDYCVHKINNAFIGTCPTMTCPCYRAHVNDEIRILEYTKWSLVVPPNDVKTFRTLALSLLLFLCAGCHVMRTLGIEAGSKKEYDQAYLNIYEFIHQYCNDTYTNKLNPRDPIMTQSSMNKLIQSLSLYCSGELSVDTLYHELFTKYFSHSLQLSDKTMWIYFKNILALIPDPERQATLQLRFLRWRPRIWTSCCNKEHCFRCRTRDFHEGRSCEENTDTLDHSIVDCPSCGLHLCKGDGCNTVTCPCGKQFAWSAEKDTIDRANQFRTFYPLHTSVCCAYVIIGKDPRELSFFSAGTPSMTGGTASTETKNNKFSNDDNENSVVMDTTDHHIHKKQSQQQQEQQSNEMTIGTTFNLYHESITSHTNTTNDNNINDNNNDDLALQTHSSSTSTSPSTVSVRRQRHYTNMSNTNTNTHHTSSRRVGVSFSNATAYSTHFPLPSSSHIIHSNTNVMMPNLRSMSSESKQTLLTNARSWQQRHSQEVSRALLDWWSSVFNICPSQACAKLLYYSKHKTTTTPPPTTAAPAAAVSVVSSVTDVCRHMSQAETEVMQMWKEHHTDEVQHYQENNLHAIKAIFETFYPRYESRGHAAVQILRLGVPTIADPSKTTHAGSKYSSNISAVDQNSSRLGFSLFPISQSRDDAMSGDDSSGSGVNNNGNNYNQNEGGDENDGSGNLYGMNDDTKALGDSYALYSEVSLPVLLRESAKLWTQENQQGYLSAYEEIEQNMADQFLYLYGATKPSLATLVRSHTPSPTSWNTHASNHSLTFTNNALTVERVGNISSYPAAFADLPQQCERSRMRVQLDHCTRGPNWLTVGLTRKGMMPVSASDGCGRTAHTWGVQDDRSQLAGLARVSANGQDIAMCRRFQQGDIVSVLVDVSEGLLEISMNENEYKYRFAIPPGSPEDYSFAMTFANDHRATMLVDDVVTDKDLVSYSGFSHAFSTNSNNSSGQAGVQARSGHDDNTQYMQTETETNNIISHQSHAINSSSPIRRDIVETATATVGRNHLHGPHIGMSVDQWYMLLALKRHMRKIDIGYDKISKDRVQLFSNKWETINRGSEQLCVHRIRENRRIIDCALCKTDYSVSATTVTATTCSMTNTEEIDYDLTNDDDTRKINWSSSTSLTWNEIMCAICWDKDQRERQDQMRYREIAITFLENHGEGAPFLAAATMYVSAEVDDTSGDNNMGNHKKSTIYQELLTSSAATSTNSSSNSHGESSVDNNESNNIQSGNERQLKNKKLVAEAFMRVFPDLMNEWYDYNKSLAEPMFGLELVPTHCRCVPRHLRHCSVISTTAATSETVANTRQSSRI